MNWPSRRAMRWLSSIVHPPTFGMAFVGQGVDGFLPHIFEYFSFSPFYPILLLFQPKNRDLCRLCAADGQSAKLESGEHFPSAEMRLLRRRIVQELLSTEKEYVRLLDDLVQVWKRK